VFWPKCNMSEYTLRDALACNSVQWCAANKALLATVATHNL
jgi:hypothetical protein